MASIETDLRTVVGSYLTARARQAGVVLIHPEQAGLRDTPSGTHLVLAYLPTRPEILTVADASQAHVWLIQVRIRATPDTGDGETTRLIDAVSEWLPPVKDFVSGKGRRYRTLTRAAPLPSYLDGVWLTTPTECRISTIR